MKKYKWLVLIIVFAYLAGCVSNPISSKENNSINENSNNTQNNNGNSAGNQAESTNNNNTIIQIPTYNDPVPSGVLEQLSWMGQGGGGGFASSQNCGSCSADMKNNAINLRNFNPQERLSILIYRDTGSKDCADATAEYVTTLYVQVDNAGNFYAPTSESSDNLNIVSIYDTTTQTEVWKNYIVPYKQIDCSIFGSGINSCPGAPTQRLEVNKMAYVCTASDTVKLREEPNKGSTILKHLVSGADVKVIGGPHCENNWSWWQVRTESGIEGWMSEGGDEVDPYFLCPRN